MRVMCKPGSVGDLGGQPPRSTRPAKPPVTPRSHPLTPIALALRINTFHGAQHGLTPRLWVGIHSWLENRNPALTPEATSTGRKSQG